MRLLGKGVSSIVTDNKGLCLLTLQTFKKIIDLKGEQGTTPGQAAAKAYTEHAGAR